MKILCGGNPSLSDILVSTVTLTLIVDEVINGLMRGMKDVVLGVDIWTLQRSICRMVRQVGGMVGRGVGEVGGGGGVLEV